MDWHGLLERSSARLRSRLLIWDVSGASGEMGREEGEAATGGQTRNREWEQEMWGSSSFFSDSPVWLLYGCLFLVSSVSPAQIQQLNQTRSRAQGANNDASSEPGVWNIRVNRKYLQCRRLNCYTE